MESDNSKGNLEELSLSPSSPLHPNFLSQTQHSPTSYPSQIHSPHPHSPQLSSISQKSSLQSSPQQSTSNSPTRPLSPQPRNYPLPDSPQQGSPQYNFPQSNSLHSSSPHSSSPHPSSLHHSSPPSRSPLSQSPPSCSPPSSSPRLSSPHFSPPRPSSSHASSPHASSPHATLRSSSPHSNFPQSDQNPPTRTPTNESPKQYYPQNASQRASPPPSSPKRSPSQNSYPRQNSNDPQDINIKSSSRTSPETSPPYPDSPELTSCPPQLTPSQKSSPQINSSHNTSSQHSTSQIVPAQLMPQFGNPTPLLSQKFPNRPRTSESTTRNSFNNSPQKSHSTINPNLIRPKVNSSHDGARSSHQKIYTPPHARANTEPANLQYSQMQKLHSQLQNLHILQKTITNSQSANFQMANNLQSANLQTQSHPQISNAHQNVNSQVRNHANYSQNANQPRHHSQSADLQTRAEQEDAEKSASKLLFSLAARPGFRPFKNEMHAASWLQRVVLESGDLVDNLLKNPQAIWEICTNAPNSANIMDALMSILGTKKLYETVKISRIKQIHGILKGTGLLHKGIASYLTQNLEPAMVGSVLDFYFAILPYLDSHECKGIPFAELHAYQYASADVGELYAQAQSQAQQASIKSVDVLPTNKDINYGPPYHLQKNIVDRPWPDFDMYIRAQFTLLREDFTNPLREVLRAVKANVPSKSHPWILSNVKAENLAILPSHAAEVGMQVSFKLQRRVINWDTFDHFKLGELVCLIGENSNKWIFAVAMFTDLSVIR